MAKTDNVKDFCKDIADSIRAKKGTSDLINPQDFSKEIMSIEGGGGSGGSGNTIEYRDVRGLGSVYRLNLVDYIAVMVRLERDGVIMTIGAKQASGFSNMLGSDAIAAISTDLNAKFITSSSEGVNIDTTKDILINHKWWEEYNSCPIITEEEFYNINRGDSGGLITFSVSTYGELTAAEGMTWFEFCNSEYNIHEFAANPNNGEVLLRSVPDETGWNYTDIVAYDDEKGRLVWSDDVIVSGKHYDERVW